MPSSSSQRSTFYRTSSSDWFSIVAFALGASFAMSFLTSLWGRSAVGYGVVVAVGLLCTGLWCAAGLRNREGPLRLVGRLCALATVGLYAFWLFLAVAFGTMLGWTVPVWLRAVLALSVVWLLAAPLLGRTRFRVPLVLPLGIWITAVLLGWVREEEVIRCDDLAALQAPLELVVPTRPDLSTCRPGELKPSGRYPRTIWQARDGGRIVFTTQGTAVPGGFEGSVCEAALVGDASPRCVGPPEGKSHGLIPIPEIDRLLAIQYGLTTPSGAGGGVVLELPLAADIEVLASHWFEDDVAQGFYEPSNQTLYMFTDSMRQVYRASIPSFEPLPPLPVSWLCPSEMHYDVEKGLGVACHGQTGAALYGAPFSVRYFNENVFSFFDRIPSATWGCNWDPLRGKVFTTLPNLGVLARIDFESGRVEKRWPIGLGMRSVEYDRERERIYVTDFLRGWVLAFDESSERIVDRWFVGRFARWVRLTPDGTALLATSNLGVVRIPL